MVDQWFKNIERKFGWKGDLIVVLLILIGALYPLGLALAEVLFALMVFYPMLPLGENLIRRANKLSPKAQHNFLGMVVRGAAAQLALTFYEGSYFEGKWVLWSVAFGVALIGFLMQRRLVGTSKSTDTTN